MSQSEVARLRQQMEAETVAMQQALSGYASVARHNFITNRYQALDRYRNELVALVGEEKATTIFCEVYMAGMEGEVQQ